MKTRFIVAAALALASLPAMAEKVEVTSFRHVGPVSVQAPIQFEATNVMGKEFAQSMLLDADMNIDLVKGGSTWAGGAISAPANGWGVGLAGFELQNSRYFKGSISVEGLENSALYVDGRKQPAGDLTLEPGSHSIVVKYLVGGGKAESLKVSIDTPDAIKDCVSIRDIATTDGRLYTVTTLLDSRRVRSVSLSPEGDYMIVNEYQRAPGANKNFVKVVERATGNVLRDGTSSYSWMPKSNKFYFTRTGNDGRELVVVDPRTGKETIMAKHLPSGSFEIAPSEDKLLFSIYEEGPKEKKEIFEIITPDDRQPGWRNRSSVAVYDLAAGVLQPVTFGYNNAYVSDIAQDGSFALISKSEARLTARPTTLQSLYKVDLKTFAVDTLYAKDGFAGGAVLSPDGKKVLLTGYPEAFNGIGQDVEPGQTPSMTDVQLFMLDIASKDIQPLTKEFDPCVSRYTWNHYDGKIYFTAETGDYVCLYSMDPASGKIGKLDLPEEMISGFSLAENAPMMAFWGQGATNSDRIYYTDMKTYGTKKQAIVLYEDLSAKSLEGITVGECIPWSFKNSLGEEVSCRFYLPVNFDPAKKYPMIVNYYGGCSPTSRNFESNYPQETWSALGYIALVVNPSGATGFGQKWSARHVNTAGVDPARDIIEATKEFTRSHEWVNADKIGCVGASYGGFMTMYLQTVTDIFACAISHAGISDHTSYWGYGYWGYSYSEVSMANSYPWTRKDLFVDQSPLYSADKVHTPLLFLHGTADTNVPYNESVQMYTALKLLGRETSFVSVLDQNHHIDDYMKHIWWHNTQMAWFAKYLQDDDTWWEALYPHKDL